MKKYKIRLLFVLKGPKKTGFMNIVSYSIINGLYVFISVSIIHVLPLGYNCPLYVYIYMYIYV